MGNLIWLAVIWLGMRVGKFEMHGFVRKLAELPGEDEKECFLRGCGAGNGKGELKSCH